MNKVSSISRTYIKEIYKLYRSGERVTLNMRSGITEYIDKIIEDYEYDGETSELVFSMIALRCGEAFDCIKEYAKYNNDARILLNNIGDSFKNPNSNLLANVLSFDESFKFYNSLMDTYFPNQKLNDRYNQYYKFVCNGIGLKTLDMNTRTVLKKIDSLLSKIDLINQDKSRSEANKKRLIEHQVFKEIEDMRSEKKLSERLLRNLYYKLVKDYELNEIGPNQNNEEIKEYYKSAQKHKCIIDCDYGKTFRYSKEKEEVTLKALNALGNNYTCIEEYIKELGKRNYNQVVPLLDQVAFQIYGEKEAYKRGVNYTVDMFGDSHDLDDPIGCCEHDKRHITIFKPSLMVVNARNTVHVINHEIEHARQQEDLKKCDFENRPDVDVLTKDDFLMNVLDDKWLEYNYFSLNQEYDADFSAWVNCLKLFDEYEDELGKYKDMIEESYNQINERYHELSAFKYKYENSLIRKDSNGKNVHINKLVEDVLDDFVHNHGIEKTKEIVNDTWPLLEYEFDLSKEQGPRRKSVRDLVRGFMNSSEKKDRVIYKKLITHMIDNHFETEEDLLKHRKELADIMKNDNLIKQLFSKEESAKKEVIRKKTGI